MKTRLLHHLHIVISVLITLPAITWIVPAYASSMPPPDVIKEARYFIPNAVYKKTVITKDYAYYEFGRNMHRVLVDVKTGKVESFYWSYHLLKPKNDVDQKTAEKRIRVWLKDRKIDITGWLLLKKSSLSSGNNGFDHRFHFGRKTPDNLITLPSYLDIIMDSDGILRSYSYHSSPVVVSIKPSFSRRQLIRRAIGAAHLINAQAVKYELSVRDADMRKGSRQILCASIELQGNITNPGVCGSGWAEILIDAHTGKVIADMRH